MHIIKNVTTGMVEQIPLTVAEETKRDAEEAAYEAGADDRAAAEVRAERNSLISATDYLALTDVPLSTEMTAYRQALRDITTQDGFPWTIEWPTQPE